MVQIKTNRVFFLQLVLGNADWPVALFVIGNGSQDISSVCVDGDCIAVVMKSLHSGLAAGRISHRR